ncbi:MAG: DUF3524 domain-containing protein [Candidatus Zixiibacteriota bacterium]
MRCLFIEPFASISHLELYHSLRELHPDWEWTLQSLPDRQWKWRNRIGALQLSQRIDEHEKYDLLITGSLLNLPEFLALCPQLQRARKIVYFHENQFAYPFRTKVTDSDKQIMYNSITTALAADISLFNSQYNRGTFLCGAKSFLNQTPVELDSEAPIRRIERDSGVFHIPVRTGAKASERRGDPPTILWNHRWEHDKAPELFFKALFALREKGIDFRLIVAGESFDVVPEIFSVAREKLAEKTISFGFVKDREEYEKLLAVADIVVSTAAQEFYGISVIEAVAAGALPVVPDSLSYPELFPREYRIPAGSSESLSKKLSALLNLGAQGLPPRSEVAQLARPHLLQTDTDRWRERFAQYLQPV